MFKRMFLPLILMVALAGPAAAETSGAYAGLKFIDSIQSTGKFSKSGDFTSLGMSEYSQNTVGGGIFVGYKGTKTDDGGVIAAGSGYYWQRIVDVPFYIVDWFGAKGDGVTDDAQAFIRARLNKSGQDRIVFFRHTEPDGKVTQGNATLKGIVHTGGGANNRGNFECQITFNGVPHETTAEVVPEG